jgi:hypothetical protein
MNIYDLDGSLKTEQWLASNYDGCRIVRGNAFNDKIFRIVAVYVTEGPAVFKAEVRAESGIPQVGQPVAFSWPSLENPAPDLDDMSQCGAPKIWTIRAKHQRVDGSGYTGFGLGPVYGPFYQSWVISPSSGSDCIVGSGMKGGTVHRGPLHVVWQLMDEGVYTGPLPSDEPKATADILSDKVRWWTEEMVRAREIGDLKKANAIQYSLVDRNAGLMYRAENSLKKLSNSCLAATME